MNFHRRPIFSLSFLPGLEKEDASAHATSIQNENWRRTCPCHRIDGVKSRQVICHAQFDCFGTVPPNRRLVGVMIRTIQVSAFDSTTDDLLVMTATAIFLRSGHRTL